MDIPSDLKYAETHEWVRIEGDVAIVGISDFAQEQLGDIVFVEVPEVGTALGKGDDAASIESAKAVGEVKAPLSGEVTEVNEALEDEPETVNSSPYGDGWLFKMKISNPSEADSLMDAAAYEGVAKEE
jgi:glycine cleavage system H protein